MAIINMLYNVLYEGNYPHYTKRYSDEIYTFHFINKSINNQLIIQSILLSISRVPVEMAMHDRRVNIALYSHTESESS